MKKLFILFGLLLLTSATIFARQATDTIPIVHTQGETIMAFLKTNAWNLALIVFLLISEWLGSTNKVKEGSIWAWIVNMIGKIIRNKTDLVTTKKAMFMTTQQYDLARKSLKFLIMALLLSAAGITAMAQSKWDGFFKPVTRDHFYYAARSQAAGMENIWKFRPAVEISAAKISYDKDLKQWSSAAFTSIGMGIGFQHYIDNGGTIYNNFGFNVLMLYTAVPTEQTQAGISIAGTVSALKFIDVGAGYDFQIKQVFILTGIKYNF
jgi:hypothetical protein